MRSYFLVSFFDAEKRLVFRKKIYHCSLVMAHSVANIEAEACLSHERYMEIRNVSVETVTE